MRILLVTQRFRPLIGGAESVLWGLARELDRLDHSVAVLTARWDKRWPEEERVDGVRVVRVPMPRVRFWGTLQYMRAVKRWLLEHGRQFDVWYVSMLKHSAWATMAAGWRCHVPVVLRVEGSGPTGDVAWQQHALGGKLIARRCRQAVAIVAISPHIRAELEQAGYPADRLYEIPNGVAIPSLPKADERPAWRQRLGLEAAGPIALYVGRLSPEKGLEDLIAAWKHVQGELADARLVTVGSGPQEADLRRRAASHANIIWAGPTQQPQRYLRAADLFVLPSHEEGISVALLEAMSFALPIVASDIPGNRILIESGRHGLLVPPRRPDLLAQAMLTQLKARTLAAVMGHAARERASEEFSITRMAQRHLELFASLTKKPPR